MIILKEGKIEKKTATHHHIVCENCKCDFVALNEDLHQILMGGMRIDAIDCPTCGRQIFEWQGGGFDKWVNL